MASEFLFFFHKGITFNQWNNYLFTFSSLFIKSWTYQITKICSTLIQIDEDNAHVLRQNPSTYIESINSAGRGLHRFDLALIMLIHGSYVDRGLESSEREDMEFECWLLDISM